MRLNKNNYEIEFIYVNKIGDYINFCLDNLNLKTKSYMAIGVFQC